MHRASRSARVSCGHPSYDSFLRDELTDFNTPVDRFGWSLLHHASNHAYPKIVDFLLVRGAEVRVPTRIPTQSHTQINQIGLVGTLVEVNRKSVAGLTPLMIALNSLTHYNQRDVYQVSDYFG